MAFVKINEQGWDKFTGDLGGIEFVDGISVQSLSSREVNRLSAGMRIESIESGEQLGIGAMLVATANDPMVAESFAIDVEQAEVVEISTAVAEPKNEWTKEALEAIADKGGIADIRKIADPLNVKGKSIAQLIDGILNINA